MLEQAFLAPKMMSNEHSQNRLTSTARFSGEIPDAPRRLFEERGDAEPKPQQIVDVVCRLARISADWGADLCGAQVS